MEPHSLVHSDEDSAPCCGFFVVVVVVVVVVVFGFFCSFLFVCLFFFSAGVTPRCPLVVSADEVCEFGEAWQDTG